ncbi:MAG TPA: carboxypeptidase-like regulatory domain-containing protein, partial [Planctomycetota bacterium]|nr:carboxypeptidase-like regulatory domain-containing protein [Planctomycetota bacterium]
MTRRAQAAVAFAAATLVGALVWRFATWTAAPDAASDDTAAIAVASDSSTVHAPGGSPPAAPVVRSKFSDAVVAESRPAGAVVGRVLAAEGRTPIAGAAVTLHDAEARPTRTAFCDATGRFSFDGVEDGRRSVRAIADGYGATTVDDVRSDAAAPTDLGDLLLERAVLVRGRMIDAGGAPVKGGTVRLERSARASVSEDLGDYERLLRPKPAVAASSVGADGTFTLPAPAAGDWLVDGAAPGFAPAASAVFRLARGAAPPVVVLTMTPGR